MRLYCGRAPIRHATWIHSRFHGRFGGPKCAELVEFRLLHYSFFWPEVRRHKVVSRLYDPSFQAIRKLLKNTLTSSGRTSRSTFKTSRAISAASMTKGRARFRKRVRSAKNMGGSWGQLNVSLVRQTVEMASNQIRGLRSSCASISRASAIASTISIDAACFAFSILPI